MCEPAERAAELGLTRGQLEALESHAIAYLREAFPLRQEMAVLKARLRTLVLSGEADSEAAAALRQEIEALMQAHRLLTEARHEAVRGLVDEEQGRFLMARGAVRSRFRARVRSAPPFGD